MEDEIKVGQLVFLTVHAEVWFKEINPKFNIPMANRLAKVVKIFDWDTEEGKLLLEIREKTGKWSSLNPKDFKYVLKVYYPELILRNKNRRGFAAEEVLPKKYPGTELKMFEQVPEWMFEDIFRIDKKSAFVVVRREENLDNKNKGTKEEDQEKN